MAAAKEMAMDRLSWIARFLKIQNKRAQLVNLRPNIGQLKLHNTIELQRKAGLPVRIIILKPRQVGWSTWTEAEGFYDIFHNSNTNGLVVSADTESTNDVFRMARLFNEMLPDKFKKPLDRSNTKELAYSQPHRSAFRMLTAGKDVLGRGGTTQFLHISEFAFWRHAAEQFNAVSKRVPNEPNTSIIIESTANGVGGAFYEMFWDAVNKHKKNPKDISGFLPVFFPWYQFPEYAVDLPQDYELIPDREEELLVERFGLTPEQLYWRRLEIEKCSGDVALFKQEYPATAREAFQTTGRNVFSQSQLDSWEPEIKRNQKFIKTGIFERRNGKVEFVPVDRKMDVWQVRWLPEPGHEYAHGSDSMEGKTSDPNNERSDPDYHGSVVLDRHLNRVAAIFKGQCDTDEFGEQCVMASEFYNMAWATPEVNSSGLVVLNSYKRHDYPHIYQRQTHDEHLIEDEAPQLGWRTTTLTRSLLVGTLKSVVREKDIDVSFMEIVDEMRTFVIDKTGKAIHLPGEHDDLLFALMIALQIHQRCPLSPPVYEASYTGDDEDRTQKRSLAYSHVIDDWEPGDGEEEDDYTA